MFDLSKVILAAGSDRPLQLVPCVVTAVTPMTVTINGVTMPGLRVPGLIYSTGHALALWSTPNIPLIIPVV